MTADLSAALAALTAELDDRPGATDHITPILSHLTIGHLRQIAAALAAPYVPGYVAVPNDQWDRYDWSAIDSTTVTRYVPGRVSAVERHYFVPAVQS